MVPEFKFGLSSAEVANQFRNLADKVDRGEVLFSSVLDTEFLSTDDYLVRQLIFVLHEKKLQLPSG